MFDFEYLKAGKLGITAAYGSFLAEAASFCLYSNEHPNPVLFAVTGDVSTSRNFGWGEVDQQFSRTWADLQEATEYGAYGIAVVIAVDLTGYPYVERSVRTTGIDYWLGDGSDERGVFQRTARLEVSGILVGDDNDIVARLKTKLTQTKRSDFTQLHAYVAIVEFALPQARFVKRMPKDDEQ